MKSSPEIPPPVKPFVRTYISRLSEYGLIELGIVAALESAALGALTPVLPLYLNHIGASSELIGLLFAVFYVALAAGEFGWGMLSDRIGIKTPLAAGTLLAGLTTAGFLVTENVNLLYAINFFRALGTAALFPTARGHIGSSVPLKNKATFMAIYMTIQALGRIFGTFLGGLIGNWRLEAVFYFAGIVFFVASAVALFSFKGKIFGVVRASADVPQTSRPSRPGWAAIINIFLLGTGITLFNFSFTVRNSFLPLYAVATTGASVADVGYLFTLWSVVSLICTLPLGRIADRLGFQMGMTIGQLILAVTMAAFAFSNTFFLLVTVMVFNSLSNCIFRPAASARFSQLMSRGRQATAMGILGVFEDVGNIFGPGIVGFIWEAPNGQFTAFMLSAACAAIGALLGMVKFNEQKSAKTESAPI